MAANEIEIQPAQDAQAKDVEDTTEDTTEDAIPQHKTTVYIDPNPTKQTGRFGKQDVVHMSLIERGVRSKGVFTVSKGRLHSSKAFYEYQLADSDGRLYKNGVWIREKDLRMEGGRG